MPRESDFFAPIASSVPSPPFCPRRPPRRLNLNSLSLAKTQDQGPPGEPALRDVTAVVAQVAIGPTERLPWNTSSK